MQLLVAVLVVLAIAAILRRFVFRDAAGQVRLPRIVDESVGMWMVRRALGRPTTTDPDPFARFRRPSTVLGRRPGPSPRSAVRAAPPAPDRRPPAVLRDPAGPEDLPVAPSWSTIERPATRGRPFGASILPPAAVPVRSRIAAVVRSAVIVVAVAIGGLTVGTIAGLASAPNGPATTPSPPGSSLRSGPPPASTGGVPPQQ